jgi:hypothetical protein
MDETSAVPAPPSRRRRTGIITAATLGTVGIAAGVIVGVGAPSGALPPVGQGSAVHYQPAAHGFGGGSIAPMSTPTSAQQVGIVDITSILGYQNAEAAGTGMILTSNGEVLTNNHVINGATSITASAVSTGASYTATVVGTDPSADVAVLHLDNASGLAAQLGGHLVPLRNQRFGLRWHRRRHRAAQAQGEGDQPLLGAVMQIPLDAAARGVGGRARGAGIAVQAARPGPSAPLPLAGSRQLTLATTPDCCLPGRPEGKAPWVSLAPQGCVPSPPRARIARSHESAAPPRRCRAGCPRGAAGSACSVSVVAGRGAIPEAPTSTGNPGHLSSGFRARKTSPAAVPPSNWATR